MSNTNPLTATERNVQRAAHHMARLGIDTIVLDYEGGGDSGGIEGFSYFDADGNAMTPRLDLTDTLTVFAWEFPDGGMRRIEKDHEVSSLNSLLQVLTFAALDEAGYSGWEINEGSRGALTIRADGSAKLSHESYVEQEDTETTVYRAADLETAGEDISALRRKILGNVAKLSAAMAAAGATLAVLEYSGRGDSGGIDGFACFGADGKTEIDVSFDASSHEVVLETIWNDVLEDISRDGYENNEGGHGRLEVRPDGTAKIIHTDVIEGSEHSEHTFGPWQDEEASAPSEATA